MDMTQALKLAEMLKANPKEWEQARLEAFDEYSAKDSVLAEYAYEIFTDKVEKKNQRREIARERAKNARKKREESVADSQENQQHNEGEFYSE